MIYLLGSPLTMIVLGLPFYQGRCLCNGDMWWAIPAANSLFILQWVIWSQMLCRKQQSYR
jgi:hypothetical protein